MAPRPSGASASGRTGSWRKFASVALLGGLSLALLLHGIGVIDLMGRDLERWSHRELAAVSEHLVEGHRNAGGRGVAFVGTVDEEWLALAPSERERVARELVNALREQGVVQVMIYDAERKLRIQALGETIRTL